MSVPKRPPTNIPIDPFEATKPSITKDMMYSRKDKTENMKRTSNAKPGNQNHFIGSNFTSGWPDGNGLSFLPQYKGTRVGFSISPASPYLFRAFADLGGVGYPCTCSL